MTVQLTEEEYKTLVNAQVMADARVKAEAKKVVDSYFTKLHDLIKSSRINLGALYSDPYAFPPYRINRLEEFNRLLDAMKAIHNEHFK